MSIVPFQKIAKMRRIIEQGESTDISFSGDMLTDSEVLRIAKTLTTTSTATNIDTLNICSTHLSLASMSVMADALRTLRGLTCLCAWAISCREPSPVELTDKLTDNRSLLGALRSLPLLKRLYLDVTDETVDALIESLREKNTYEKIGIRVAPESAMCDASFCKLLDFLATNDLRVRALWLQSHNTFNNPRMLSDAEVLAFARVLNRNSRLHDFEIGS